MKYQGGCHCKKVRFEVEMSIDQAISCNCSICSKRGSILGFAPEEKFKLLAGQDELSNYQFNKHIVHHLFCKTCGILSFGKGKDPSGKTVMAINVRCLDNIDLSKITVIPYDGKSL